MYDHVAVRVSPAARSKFAEYAAVPGDPFVTMTVTPLMLAHEYVMAEDAGDPPATPNPATITAVATLADIRRIRITAPSLID